MVLLGQIGVSQTYIWGGPGDKNSEFDGGLNDWTTYGEPENALWEWKENGAADKGNYFGNRGPIQSPSVANGAATFDSDYYGYNKIAPTPHTGYLESPAFSCVGHESVWVQFNQYFRNFASITSLEVSVDGGENWESVGNVNPDYSYNDETSDDDVKLIDITNFAKNQPDVRFRFVFAPNPQDNRCFYFWVIDDVYVIDSPKADPQITGTWFPPQFFNTPQAFIAADSFYFIMEVQNKGGSESKDILGKVTLVNTSTSTTYHTDSVKFDIATGETDTIEFSSFMPSTDMDTGHYAAVYDIFVDSAATDAWKRFIQYFDVTGNMLVKKVDNGRLYTNALTTNDDDTESYIKIGEEKEEYNVNHYRTGDWADNDYVSIVATDVTMSLAIGEQDDTLVFDTDVSVLKLADTILPLLQNLSGEGLVVDNKPNPQMESIGYSAEHFDTVVEYSEFITPLYNGDDDKDIALEPNSKYLIAARWGTDQTYYQGIDNKYSVYPRYYFSGQLEYLLYTSDGGFSRFSGSTGGGWHMGLLLKLVVPFPESIDEEDLLPENTVIIKENPVRDRLTVDVDFQKNIEKATMVIHDINGQIIDMRTVKDLNRGTFNFYTNNLPTGTYIFTIFTKDKLLSKKFVVAK